MNLKEIRDLVQLVEESDIDEFELERSGVRIRIKKAAAAPPETLSRVTETRQAAALEAPPAAGKPPQEEEELYVFKAPIVGTFYLSPKPDAEPFVRDGDHVKKGAVLCIIEAMKLFNQIESDVEGQIVKILVENGEPVEYGQPLFHIRVKSEE